VYTIRQWDSGRGTMCTIGMCDQGTVVGHYVPTIIWRYEGTESVCTFSWWNSGRGTVCTLIWCKSTGRTFVLLSCVRLGNGVYHYSSWLDVGGRALFTICRLHRIEQQASVYSTVG
jgi:hypothetical protein